MTSATLWIRTTSTGPTGKESSACVQSITPLRRPLAEQLLGAGELVAEGPPDREVIGQRLAERAHAAPPGHGRASARNASVSALA